LFVLIDPKPEQDHGGLHIAAGRQVRRHAEGEGAEEDPADPGQPVEPGQQHQYSARADGHQRDHAHSAQPAAAAFAGPRRRCHHPGLHPTAAATAGGWTAAAVAPR